MRCSRVNRIAQPPRLLSAIISCAAAIASSSLPALAAARRKTITVRVVALSALSFGVMMGLLAFVPDQAIAFPICLLVGVASITFWGAIYGGLFGLALPWARGPLWLNGMVAGLCAMTLSWFVFLPLMGHHAAFG